MSAPVIAVVLRLLFGGFQLPITGMLLPECCCASSQVSFIPTEVMIQIFVAEVTLFAIGGIILVFGCKMPPAPLAPYALVRAREA